MTSKVTVDAHAGWDVLVKLLDSSGGHLVKIIPAGTEEDIYLHSDLIITHIEELYKEI